MLIDIKPLLKYRDFRLLYLGQFVSWFGNMLVYVALPYQIYSLTHSSLAVGMVGVVELIPLLITALWGGALADKLERRKILIVAEIGLCIISGLFILNSLQAHPHLWLVYLLAGLLSAFSGFHRPTIEALIQILVKENDMPAVAALKNFQFAVVMIAGPALAGILLSIYGLPIVYLLDFLTFVTSLIAVLFMKTRFTAKKTEDSIIATIKSGVRYAMSRQELIGTYVIDFMAMIFGMPQALFPAIADKFHSITALGWLYAGPSIGLLLTSIFSGWVAKVHRQGVAISIAATVWGFAIIAFGFSHNIYVSVLFLAIAGGADSISGIFRGIIWNQTIPPHLRGRLASIEMISYMSGPLLGNAEAGLVAALFGVTFSVVSGGALCVISVMVFTTLLPKFWTYTHRTSRGDF
jgi:MFS family permease